MTDMHQGPVGLCLASHSPRRRGLLELLGVPFFVQAAGSEVEESVLGQGRGAQAEEVALARARVKGQSVAAALDACCAVLSADTIVHLEQDILDKPQGPEEARSFLGRLSGREHGVVTALWLFKEGREYSAWQRTWVEFAPLSAATIEAYIETGEPYDKAGGYGIQGIGGSLIRGIRGCYFNVVGLPLHATAQLLEQAHIPWQLKGSC